MLDSMTISPVAQFPPAAFNKPFDDVSRRGKPAIQQALAQSPPLRTTTYPPHSVSVLKKRIVVCCDGTWQDGTVVDAQWKYTNVLRLARAVRHVDTRVNPPVHQVVFYQSGVGSANNFYSELVDGATGASLADKVEEAYAFITQNYHPGDEILLFGFSRGAYTARTIAALIGRIGVLSRTEMDHFADIFIALQKLGNQDDLDPEEKALLETKIAPWTGPDSPGCRRATGGPEGFSVKCVGVFDTVGSVGLPEELTKLSKSVKTLFGFHSTELGPHIEKAYQALALNERRADFNCAKFRQTEAGRMKQQVLRQCWFAGCHSDIGGGYREPDLANLTLAWMAAHVGDILYLDTDYLGSRLEAVQPWGELSPHDSIVGIFELAEKIQRELPVKTDSVTHETIHPSVLMQKNPIPELADIIKKKPSIVCGLLPLEQELQRNWKVTGKKTATIQYLSEAIRTTHSSSELASDPDKTDAAHEAARTPGGSSGRWVGTILSWSNQPVAIPRYYGGILASSFAVAYYSYISVSRT